MRDFDAPIRKKLSIVALFLMLAIVFFTILRLLTLDHDQINMLKPIILFVEYSVCYLICRYTKTPVKVMTTVFLIILVQAIVQGLFFQPMNGIGIFVSVGIVFSVIYIQSLWHFNIFALILISLFIIANEADYIHQSEAIYILSLFAHFANMILCNIIIQQRLYLSERVFNKTAHQDKYQKSNLSNEDISDLSDEIALYLEEKNEYLDPDFKARNLASNLEIPLYKLSQVLNVGMGISFSDLLHNYRIEEVKRRLLDPKYKNENIIDIAFDCGFSTKSSFNTLFKSKTGLTPSEFKKKGRGHYESH